jgi:hypothetical protein
MPPIKRKAKYSKEDVNIRASSFYVMQTRAHCWTCRSQTAVIGFAVAPGFEVREWENEAQKAHAPWVRQNVAGVVYWLGYLAPNIVAHAQRINSHYRSDYSSTLKVHYWMNHCELCDAKMGDNYLYNEGEPPFGRLSVSDVASTQFTHIKEPFTASMDSWGDSDELLAAMN